MYDGDRRLANVPISEVDLAWDAGAFVAGSGSLRVTWADDHARSMIPRQIGDWFAPFGAELQVDCLVGAGVFTERIQMGRFVIESIPDTVESDLLWQGRLIHPGQSFGVRLRDGLVRVAQDKYAFPTASRSTSVWDEIQTVTGLPVIRNVPDASIDNPVTHDDEKSAATSRLFDRLKAWPAVTPSGVITARPKAWTSPVDDLTQVVAAPRVLTSDVTYNRVVVEGRDPAGVPIYAVAEIVDGFLRVANLGGAASPFGVKTYAYQSEYLTTFQQCQDYAAELLQRVSRIRSVVREVTERFNPLREIGDVLTFEGGLVRVQKVSHSDAETRLTVEVPDS